MQLGTVLASDQRQQTQTILSDGKTIVLSGVGRAFGAHVGEEIELRRESRRGAVVWKGLRLEPAAPAPGRPR